MALRPHQLASEPLRLADLRQRIEGLFDGLHAGVYGVDNLGRATLVTPSVAAMTGYTLDDLVGRSVHELLHHSHANGEGYPRERCPIYAAFRDGRVHRAEEVFWRKDGTSFPVEYTSTPLVQGGDLVGAVVVFRDLIERRQLQDRLCRALGALERQAEPGEPGHDHPATARGCAAGAAPVGLVGQSQAWQAAMDGVRRVAATDSTVLLLGESGTGKELVARAIHQQSPRRDHPLVKLNCAAIPTSLVEGELFGHERGAFTGATAQHIGRFEQAGDGTLLLDEVGELPFEAQAKLLRVLQEREFERLGGTRTLRSRARVIAATNRSLVDLVKQGRFRPDLFYRLNVFPLRLPSLRQRRSDIPLLTRHFLAKLEPRLGRRLRGFSPEAERRLLTHSWPGNVRELENVVERSALLADGPWLDVAAIDDSLQAGDQPACPPETGPAAASPALSPCGPGDRERMIAALERVGWKVTGPRGAAAALAIHPNTLRYRMRRLGICRPA